MSENERGLILEKLEAIISIEKDVEFIKKGMEELKSLFTQRESSNDTKFVTQDQFKPVKLVVYGLVGLIMISVLKELLTLA